MNADVNVVDAVLFTKSHVNTVVEQHFRDVEQQVMDGNNLDSFDSRFAKHFTLKPSPQQCRKIVSFNIIYAVNTIGSMETWGKSSCSICMK